jgi:small-conductance mechanosensitive channel
LGVLSMLRSPAPVEPAGDIAIVEAFRTEGLTALDFSIGIGIFIGSIVVSRVVKYVLQRTLDRRLDTALAVLIARLFGYLVMVIGLVYSLESLGVAVGPVLGALGIAGIALAFAFQDILENFIAGILLQLKRPFTYGDQVQINDYEGVVREIDSRLVTILTPDGETVMIPSATVIKAEINNYTNHGLRRTSLPVGVAYGTDLRRAGAVLLDAAASVPEALEQPPAEVFLEGFGDSSIDFVVRFWHEPTIAGFWKARSEVAYAIDEALKAADITIPFPQRVLHFGGSSPESAEADPSSDGSSN